MALVPTTAELEEAFPEAIAELDAWLREDLRDPSGPARAAVGISENLEAAGCDVPLKAGVQISLLESATVRAEIERKFSLAVSLGAVMIWASRAFERMGRRPLGETVGGSGLGLPPDGHFREMGRHMANAEAMIKRINPVCGSTREMIVIDEEAHEAWAHWMSIPTRIRESSAHERDRIRSLMKRVVNMRQRFLRTCIRSGRNRLDGFDGAAKVCVEYFRGPSGKVRCKKWSSGAGYTPGPHPEGDYFIQDVRDHYSRILCEQGDTRAKCGLKRKYRYRRSLPYLPREVVERLGPEARKRARMSPVSTKGAIRIIALGPAAPVRD